MSLVTFSPLLTFYEMKWYCKWWNSEHLMYAVNFIFSSWSFYELTMHFSPCIDGSHVCNSISLLWPVASVCASLLFASATHNYLIWYADRSPERSQKGLFFAGGVPSFLGLAYAMSKCPAPLVSVPWILNSNSFGLRVFLSLRAHIFSFLLFFPWTTPYVELSFTMSRNPNSGTSFRNTIDVIATTFDMCNLIAGDIFRPLISLSTRLYGSFGHRLYTYKSGN